MATLSLAVRCDHTQWGEVVAVVGSWCDWNTDKTTLLKTSPTSFPKWTGVVVVPSNSNRVEYKYVIVKDGRVARWESGDNRSLSCPPPNAALAYDDGKFGDGGRNRKRQGAHAASTHVKSPIVSRGIPNARECIRAVPTENGYRLGDDPHAGIAAPTPVDALPAIERLLVRVTAEQKSWRQRLQFVQKILAVPSPDSEPDLIEAHTDSINVEGLAVIAAYLSFLSTGQLPCAEDGAHYRPNHHAGAAQAIESALLSRPSPAYESYVTRRVYTLLPSYSSQFTVSVPLTRIRDIAHRGDIPHDLKQEIKHTLQNKLHRCAGPEDLVTCANILERVERNGGYSRPFVEELRRFYAELQEFFNAKSLDERLEGLENDHGEIRRPVQHLRHLKRMNACPLEQLSSASQLRLAISNSTSMRNGDNAATEQLQKLRLADIELEAYAFPLLSAVAANVEADLAAKAYARLFVSLYSALELAFTNVQLSGVREFEAEAIVAELSALGKLDEDPTKHVSRAKAAIDRAIAFTDHFAGAMARMYGSRIISLAAALGVEARAAAVFGEAEIRANVTFLASRIANAGAAACRHMLNMPPWDPLFIGTAKGCVVYVDHLENVNYGDDKPTIIVARDSTGEEDLPGNVTGVVLGRPLPHLSHLGVRARQAKVVFVCAEDTAVFDSVWRSRYEFGKMTVDSREGLRWEQTEESQISIVDKPNGVPNDDVGRTVTLSELDKEGKLVVPISEATKANSSSKCFSVAQMTKLGKASAGSFTVPKACCITHAAFIGQQKKAGKKYKAVVKKYETASKKGDEVHMKAAAAEARAFIEKNFVLSSGVIGEVQKLLGNSKRVMVRSSANAEDLATMSGAGLYDSLANIKVSNTKELTEAVIRVWGSVWTARAGSSRVTCGVSHQAVSMGVLLQEMVDADLSFVAFSKDPVTGSDVGVYIEVAVGMGETLASGARGTPYRFLVGREKKGRNIRTLALANVSDELSPAKVGGGLQRRPVNYSKQRMTTDAAFREDLASKIADCVLQLEKTFGGPQDVEGAILVRKDCAQVHLVQARPQLL